VYQGLSSPELLLASGIGTFSWKGLEGSPEEAPNGLLGCEEAGLPPNGDTGLPLAAPPNGDAGGGAAEGEANGLAGGLGELEKGLLAGALLASDWPEEGGEEGGADWPKGLAGGEAPEGGGEAKGLAGVEGLGSVRFFGLGLYAEGSPKSAGSGLSFLGLNFCVS